jgi:hypothetical protein
LSNYPIEEEEEEDPFSKLKITPQATEINMSEQWVVVVVPCLVVLIIEALILIVCPISRMRLRCFSCKSKMILPHSYFFLPHSRMIYLHVPTYMCIGNTNYQTFVNITIKGVHVCLSDFTEILSEFIGSSEQDLMRKNHQGVINLHSKINKY